VIDPSDGGLDPQRGLERALVVGERQIDRGCERERRLVLPRAGGDQQEPQSKRARCAQ
jgi:hypothetical protein